MVFSRKRFSRRTACKRLVTSIGLYFLLATAGYSQEQVLPLELEPYKVAKNEFLYATMYVDHDVADELKITEPKLPPSLQLYWGPRIRPVRRSGEYGPEQVIEIAYKFRAIRTGWYVLDPFHIRIQILNLFARDLVTEPISFGVGVQNKEEVVVPPEPEWYIPRDTIYQGEALPITLKLGEREDIGMITSVNVTSPDQGLFESIASYGNIELNQVGDRVLYTLPVASYMFTPTSPGRILIPSASLTLKNISGKTGNTYITVLPFPKEAAETGALGKLRFSTWSDSGDTIEETEEAVVHLRVEGEGNLNYLTFPEPVCEGGVLLNREENHSYSPSDAGYSGFREETFRFSPDNTGTMTVTVPPFVWFDKELNFVRETGGDSFLFSVILSEKGGQEEPPAVRKELELKSAEEILSFRKISYYNSIRSYAWLLPGIVLLVLCIILKNLKILFVSLALFCIAAGGGESEDEGRGQVTQGIEAFGREDYTGAVYFFSKAQDLLPDNGCLVYNLGITQFKAGNPGMAIYFLRRANYLLPKDASVRKAVETVETAAGIQIAPQPLFRVHTNTYFLFFVLLGNAAFIAAGVYYIRRKGVYAIIFILLIVLTTGSVGTLIFSAVKRNRMYGVALNEISVKKIPGEKGESWIDIQEGTSVRVLYDNDGYLFSEIGPGLQGWIKEHEIRIINP